MPVLAPCDGLSSGTRVRGLGHRIFCIDVNGSTLDGAKLLMRLSTPRSVSEIRIGDTLLFSRRGNSTAAGPLVVVSRSPELCEPCNSCPCVDCGDGCGCACASSCREGRGQYCSSAECSCSLTAGLLSPGRWYVTVDALGPFVLEPTLVPATRLVSGDAVQRTLLVAGAAPQPLPDGPASLDFFYVDPLPHKSIDVTLDVTAGGSSATEPYTWVDVYLRSGDWPTTVLQDAHMTADPQMPPRLSFHLQAERLFNDRLYIMVVARGASWVRYELTAGDELNGRYWTGLGFVVLVAICAGVQFWRHVLRSRANPEARPILAGIQPR